VSLCIESRGIRGRLRCLGDLTVKAGAESVGTGRIGIWGRLLPNALRGVQERIRVKGDIIRRWWGVAARLGNFSDMAVKPRAETSIWHRIRLLGNLIVASFQPSRNIGSLGVRGVVCLSRLWEGMRAGFRRFGYIPTCARMVFGKLLWGVMVDLATAIIFQGRIENWYW